MSDGEKVKITELESTIERLTAELASVHESADKKIRSLRQEYEKLRFQYDNKLPTTTEVSTPTNTKDRSGFYSESQVVDDIPLAQAHEKIRYVTTFLLISSF